MTFGKLRNVIFRRFTVFKKNFYEKFHTFTVQYGVSAGKRDQILFFFKNKFICKIDVDLIIWYRTSVILKKKFFVDFPALLPYHTPSKYYLIFVILSHYCTTLLVFFIVRL